VTIFEDDGRRIALQGERDFLLRSLDDLDAELLAGNIEPETYRTLHDDYTARAADAINALAAHEALEEDHGPKSPSALKFVTYGGIAVFVLLAFLLSQTVGDRKPGQTASGNDQVTATTLARDSALDAARAAVAKAPNSYEAHLHYARALLQTRANGGPFYADAIQEYVEASQIDPKQAEPLAYSGWVSALVATATSDAPSKRTLLDVAGQRLDQAIRVDPSYTDSYVFKGLVLARYENKPCDAVAPFQQFLTKAPQDHPMREQVLSALSQAVAAGKCPTSNTISP
jgi:cytochrome c-type biogenesis protein CcmH/NrfG